MKIASTALIATILLTLVSPAADPDAAEKKHPIDIKVDKLSNEAQSTVETRDAFEQGLKLWDKEMNRVYQELKKALPEESFAALKASQVQWLAYRDAQIAFIDSCYEHFEGTMYGPMQASAVMEVTRARTLDLTHRLTMHKEHAEEGRQ